MAAEKILVVEDSLRLREVIEEYLIEQGYAVVTAADGRDGKAVFLKERPVLVLAGYMMPYETGFGLMEWIQTRGFGTPVIMFTASATLDVQEEAFRLGAAAFITKPFKFDALLECISNTLEKHRQNKSVT